MLLLLTVSPMEHPMIPYRYGKFYAFELDGALGRIPKTASSLIGLDLHCLTRLSHVPGRRSKGMAQLLKAVRRLPSRLGRYPPLSTYFWR
jgi:hypothetical protein